MAAKETAVDGKKPFIQFISRPPTNVNQAWQPRQGDSLKSGGVSLPEDYEPEILSVAAALPGLRWKNGLPGFMGHVFQRPVHPHLPCLRISRFQKSVNDPPALV
jgi:hypothetical protein